VSDEFRRAAVEPGNPRARPRVYTRPVRGDGELERRLDACVFRVRQGDARAPEEIDHLLRPLVERDVRRRLNGSGGRWVSPADLAQVVLAENILPEHLARLPVRGAGRELLGWVGQSIKCRVADALRNNGKLIGESEAPATPVASPVPSQGAVTKGDEHQKLRELVARLPAKYAEAVQLVTFDGLAYAEAGERLGISADAVRKRLEVALERLRRRLGEGDGV